MDSSFEITSLFEQRPRVRRGFVSAYALSMVMHGAGIGLGFWVLIHAPVIRVVPVNNRYAVRELKLDMPEHVPTTTDQLYPDHVKPPAGKKATTPATQPAPPADTPREAAKTNAPPLPPVPTEGGVNKQILMQPKLHIDEQLTEKIPVPSAMMWMPELNHTKVIIPAKPTPATQAVVPPSVVEPNEELELSEMSVSSVDLQPKVQTPPPSTTTPLAQNGPGLVKLPPTTDSDAPGQPTPTALLSVSDVRMPEGIAVLPPVNETGVGSKTAGAGARPAGNGSSSAGQPEGRPLANGTASAHGAGAAVASDSSSTSSQASDSETVDHIQLPPTGQFGVVVIGSSQTGQYPEAAEFWSDRVAYTVYLHVGLPKTWILQYGLAGTAQANGTGSVARIDAPWPFDIFRPNLLAVDVNADALMVHGVLNASGKLEQLAVAFPEGFPHASFVVNALSRWKFRPASQDGKPVPVEILLIIPEEDD